MKPLSSLSSSPIVPSDPNLEHSNKYDSINRNSGVVRLPSIAMTNGSKKNSTTSFNNNNEKKVSSSSARLPTTHKSTLHSATASSSARKFSLPASSVNNNSGGGGAASSATSFFRPRKISKKDQRVLDKYLGPLLASQSIRSDDDNNNSSNTQVVSPASLFYGSGGGNNNNNCHSFSSSNNINTIHGESGETQQPQVSGALNSSGLLPQYETPSFQNVPPRIDTGNNSSRSGRNNNNNNNNNSRHQLTQNNRSLSLVSSSSVAQKQPEVNNNNNNNRSVVTTVANKTPTTFRLSAQLERKYEQKLASGRRQARLMYSREQRDETLTPASSIESHAVFSAENNNKKNTTIRKNTAIMSKLFSEPDQEALVMSSPNRQLLSTEKIISGILRFARHQHQVGATSSKIISNTALKKHMKNKNSLKLSEDDVLNLTASSMEKLKEVENNNNSKNGSNNNNRALVLSENNSASSSTRQQKDRELALVAANKTDSDLSYIFKSIDVCNNSSSALGSQPQQYQRLLSPMTGNSNNNTNKNSTTTKEDIDWSGSAGSRGNNNKQLSSVTKKQASIPHPPVAPPPPPPPQAQPFDKKNLVGLSTDQQKVIDSKQNTSRRKDREGVDDDDEFYNNNNNNDQQQQVIHPVGNRVFIRSQINAKMDFLRENEDVRQKEFEEVVVKKALADKKQFHEEQLRKRQSALSLTLASNNNNNNRSALKDSAGNLISNEDESVLKENQLRKLEEYRALSTDEKRELFKKNRVEQRKHMIMDNQCAVHLEPELVAKMRWLVVIHSVMRIRHLATAMLVEKLDLKNFMQTPEKLQHALDCLELYKGSEHAELRFRAIKRIENKMTTWAINRRIKRKREATATIKQTLRLRMYLQTIMRNTRYHRDTVIWCQTIARKWLRRKKFQLWSMRLQWARAEKMVMAAAANPICMNERDISFYEVLVSAILRELRVCFRRGYWKQLEKVATVAKSTRNAIKTGGESNNNNNINLSKPSSISVTPAETPTTSSLTPPSSHLMMINNQHHQNHQKINNNNNGLPHQNELFFRSLELPMYYRVYRQRSLPTTLSSPFVAGAVGQQQYFNNNNRNNNNADVINEKNPYLKQKNDPSEFFSEFFKLPKTVLDSAKRGLTARYLPLIRELMPLVKRARQAVSEFQLKCKTENKPAPMTSSSTSNQMMMNNPTNTAASNNNDQNNNNNNENKDDQQQQPEETDEIQDLGGILVPLDAFDPLSFWHLLELQVGIACPSVNPECVLQRNHRKSKRHGSYFIQNRRQSLDDDNIRQNDNNDTSLHRSLVQNFQKESQLERSEIFAGDDDDEDRFLSLETGKSLWHESEVQEYHLPPVIQSATSASVLSDEDEFGRNNNNNRRRRRLAMNRDPWDLIFIPMSASSSNLVASMRMNNNTSDNNKTAEFGQFVNA